MSRSSRTTQIPYRQLGSSELSVSPVGIGCWPIAGVSSLDVHEADSLRTLHAALDQGINFIDTAYSYGYDGQADQIIARVLRQHPGSRPFVASKVGAFYDKQRQRRTDGRPETLVAQAEQVLKRLSIEQVDLMYLHEPDPLVPIEDSAAGIADIVNRGWARYAGVSNVNLQQLAAFQSICPVVVVQPPFNLLQQEKVLAIRDFCIQNQIAIACYWVLMKGLLAGHMLRDHRFDPADRRLSYPIYQGQAWQNSQDLLDHLRQLAVELDATVAQVVIAWTLAQPGITVALCGAKRPGQIEETAQAMTLDLDEHDIARIDAWIAELAQV